jgi:hypothetical protein
VKEEANYALNSPEFSEKLKISLWGVCKFHKEIASQRFGRYKLRAKCIKTSDNLGQKYKRAK